MPRRPDVWQGAFVAGGYRRVVDTAIAALAMRDQVLVSRRGVLPLVGSEPTGGPVERAVYAVEKQARSHGLMLGGTRAVWWYLVMLPFLTIAGVGLTVDSADPDLVWRRWASMPSTGWTCAGRCRRAQVSLVPVTATDRRRRATHRV